jgi:hypothetical protein
MPGKRSGDQFRLIVAALTQAALMQGYRYDDIRSEAWSVVFGQSQQTFCEPAA